VAGVAEYGPVSYALALAARAHRAELERLLRGHGLYVGQERIVFELAAAPGISQTELSDRIGAAQPAVAKTVARMARQGLVSSRPDPGDARMTRLYLTEQGAALLPEVRACWRAVERAFTAGLSAAEREQLRALLARARKNLEDTHGC
jgi:MarR family transcriptional regulator, organic hydroperoxide resistance regulator